MPPERLFNAAEVRLSSRVDCLFFVASHELPDVTVRPIDPQQVARRMAFSLQYERLDFMSYYLKYRFAFPERRNELIERAGQLERELLIQALAGKEAYEVYHPYPVPIPAMFDAISPLINRSIRAATSLHATA
jgi:hypothetical protein